jgi:hypothetical protein
MWSAKHCGVSTLGQKSGQSLLMDPAFSNTGDDSELHVLKLSHNPVWDHIDLRPIWHDLHKTWNSVGDGLPQYHFMALYKKQSPASSHNTVMYAGYNTQLQPRLNVLRRICGP